MTKQDFLTQLRNGLSELPEKELEERLSFYSEMIDDQMEEGLSQEEAVAAVGSITQILSQATEEIPAAKPSEAAPRARQRKVWEILLLVLGSPIWLSLGIAAFAVVLCLYVSLWAVIISLWAVFVALVSCAAGITGAGVILACNGNTLSGIALLGAGMVCAGLSVFAFYICKGVSKGSATLTKKLVDRFAKRRKRNA